MPSPRAVAIAAVHDFRRGAFATARAALAAVAHAGDPYTAAVTLLLAHVLDDRALHTTVDAAAQWANLQRPDADADARTFFGGAYATTIGEALAARDILTAALRHAAALDVSVEALLAAAELGDRALRAHVHVRLATLATDAPAAGRAIAEHVAALEERAAGNAGAARMAAQRAQRAYLRAGWTYYAARVAELAGDERTAEGTYRRLAAARDLKRLTGGDGLRTPSDPLARLAPRERDVAELIAAGLANKDIAQRLNIAAKTVEKNVTAIYAKLGVTRRVQLARVLAPPPPPANVPTGTLPEPLSPFVGRAEELAELHDRAARNRLISLIGAGGSGKTRLATEFAKRERAFTPDGVWFIDLAPVNDGGAVWPLLAATLGVPRDPQRSLDAVVVAWLAERAPLLVVDNCEHLMPAIARTVHALTNASAHLRIIATSRERLGIFGENIFRVGAMRTHDGAAFFCERARAAGAGAIDASVAAAICDRLDGIPLAIELAAARLYDCTLDELTRALEERTILQSREIGITPRHHSIDALVEWAYEPLPPHVQRAFRHSAVFPDAFAPATASRLFDADADAATILETLHRKSLIERLPAQRYRLLQVVRDVALAKLRAAGEEDAAFATFAQTYDELLRTANDAWYVQPIAAWIEPFRNETRNILAAIDWTLARGNDIAAGIRMTANAARIWSELAREPELEPYLTEALRLAPDAPPRVRAALWLARARALDVVRAGTPAVDAAHHAFDAARAGGDPVDIAMAHLAIGSAAATLRDLPTAREHLERALEQSRALGLRRPEASTLTALAIIAATDEQRVEMFGRVLEIARSLDDSLLAAITLSNLSIATAELGDVERARENAREAATIFEGLGAPMRLARAQIELARTEFACGDFAAACAAASTALRYFAALDAPLLRADCAAWIAKALAPAEPELAARFWGYCGAMRSGASASDADRIAQETLSARLGAAAFARLAESGAASDANALLVALPPGA